MSGEVYTWGDLDFELAQWHSAGRRVTLWWRDDDATTDGPALQRLLGLSCDWQVPLSLAVIPARASSSLLTPLHNCPRVVVLQHGYAHIDYAGGAEPAAELGEHRAQSEVLDELVRGRQRLHEILGTIFMPVLVPPWNRIAPVLAAELEGLGYRGLSCFSARQWYKGAHNLSLVNCHVDPINWKAGGVFRGESKSLAMMISHLRARRRGEVDADEATGVLTHHWRHDEATWAFVEQLFERIRAHSDVHWLDAHEVFCS
jgi:hypothetical protein